MVGGKDFCLRLASVLELIAVAFDFKTSAAARLNVGTFPCSWTDFGFLTTLSPGLVVVDADVCGTDIVGSLASFAGVPTDFVLFDSDCSPSINFLFEPEEGLFMFSRMLFSPVTWPSESAVFDVGSTFVLSVSAERCFEAESLRGYWTAGAHGVFVGSMARCLTMLDLPFGFSAPRLCLPSRLSAIGAA